MPYVGEVAALGSAACWAVASVLFARAAEDTSPLVANFVKCGLAAALLSITAVALEGVGAFLALSARDLALLTWSGLLGLTVSDTLYFHALVHLGPRRGALALSSAAPLTAVLAAWLLGERIAPLGWLGIGVTLAGVSWVLSERARTGPAVGVPLAGIAAGLLAAIAQSSADVATKAAAGEHPAVVLGAVRTGAAFLGLGAHVLLTRSVPRVWRALGDRRTRTLLLRATVLGTYLGIWLASAGVRYAPAGIAATLGSTAPLFLVPLSIYWLRESVSWRAGLGALVAIAGVAAVFLSR